MFEITQYERTLAEFDYILATYNYNGEHFQDLINEYIESKNRFPEVNVYLCYNLKEEFLFVSFAFSKQFLEERKQVKVII